MPNNSTHLHRNEVHLAGELARDSEIRNTSSGKTLATFTVLTKYQQWTEYHRVTAWEGLAEKVGKLRKGESNGIIGYTKAAHAEMNPLDVDGPSSWLITQIIILSRRAVVNTRTGS